MKCEVKKLNTTKRKITICVEAKEFEQEKNEVYVQMSNKLKLPGFRKGKVPLELLDKYHAKTLREELIQKIVPIFYQRGLEAEKIVAASYPNIYNVELTKESLSFEAELEVKPEIILKEEDYKGIKIKEKNIEIKDKEMEQVITDMRTGINKILPNEINEETLARWLGHSHIQALKDLVSHQIYLEKMHERKRKIDTDVQKHLLERISFSVPESVVDQHHQELLERELYQLKTQGISQEDIDKYKKDIEQRLRTKAQEEVKLYYILDEIAHKENLKIENAKNIKDIVLGYILSQAQY